VPKPSDFFRDQIRKAEIAGQQGDSTATRQHLDRRVAEDPDAIAVIREALTRRP
jgi:hypothetical protein